LTSGADELFHLVYPSYYTPGSKIQDHLSSIKNQVSVYFFALPFAFSTGYFLSLIASTLASGALRLCHLQSVICHLMHLPPIPSIPEFNDSPLMFFYVHAHPFLSLEGPFRGRKCGSKPAFGPIFLLF
jgi:hypothetical protein